LTETEFAEDSEHYQERTESVLPVRRRRLSEDAEAIKPPHQWSKKGQNRVIRTSMLNIIPSMYASSRFVVI